MQVLPRITVEVPVVRVGNGGSDYEALGNHVNALRRVQGLHLTLLHIGILPDFAQEVADWTKGMTSTDATTRRTVSWLQALPVLVSFAGSAERLIVLGGGSVAGLEVDVPSPVHDYRVFLVRGLHNLLDELLVDDVDDFILGSRALGFRSPRWIPHVAVGRPQTRDRGPRQIPPLTVEFGESRIRNARFLPAVDDA